MNTVHRCTGLPFCTIEKLFADQHDFVSLAWGINRSRSRSGDGASAGRMHRFPLIPSTPGHLKIQNGSGTHDGCTLTHLRNGRTIIHSALVTLRVAHSNRRPARRVSRGRRVDPVRPAAYPVVKCLHCLLRLLFLQCIYHRPSRPSCSAAAGLPPSPSPSRRS